MDDAARGAIEYFESFINYERTLEWRYPEDLKLDRMRALVRELGHPQNAFDSVIIAGSKGKGSTAAMLSSILRMDDHKVGLFTSPHLSDLRERIRVNGLAISPARLAEGAYAIRKALDSPEWRRNPPTYFEALTALAFWHFREMKVQIAVLEVGLGGLYDSTNVAPAKAVGLAPISLEHTDKLGKTLAKIAVQKAGVIKGREQVVSAPQPEEAEAVFEKACREREAPLYRVNREIKLYVRSHDEREQSFDLRSELGDFYDLRIGLLGRHQIDNAAVAVGLAKAIEKKTRLRVSDAAVRRGLVDARWPGRLERVCERPDIVLDGAQNPESARRLAEALRRHFHYRRLILVFGVSSDKDREGMLEALLPEAAELIATRSVNPRAVPPGDILRSVEGRSVDVRSCEDVASALNAARSSAKENDLILVTGSLFVVGEARRLLVGDPA